MDSHYDFFVAGRWRNKDAVVALAKGIRACGYTTYCFLESAHNADKQEVHPDEHMDHFEKLDWKSDPYVRQVFEEDMAAERASDTFVVLLPIGKSCHIEAGVAYGLGKKCIAIGEQKEAESLYLIFHETYDTVEDFLRSLRRR